MMVQCLRSLVCPDECAEEWDYQIYVKNVAIELARIGNTELSDALWIPTDRRCLFHEDYLAYDPVLNRKPVQHVWHIGRNMRECIFQHVDLIVPLFRTFIR